MPDSDSAKTIAMKVRVESPSSTSLIRPRGSIVFLVNCSNSMIEDKGFSPRRHDLSMASLKWEIKIDFSEWDVV